MTALNLVDKVKGSSPSANLTARELALDFGDCTHRPALLMHTPGMQTKWQMLSPDERTQQKIRLTDDLERYQGKRHSISW